MTQSGPSTSGQTPDVSIVIPTYREAENARALLTRIAEAMRRDGRAYEILIVDDDSRDGIDLAVRDLAASCPARLIIRTGFRDLSQAVLDGMRQARGRDILVMDADLSHPPEAIPRLLDTLETPPTDFVIGSRYIAGGSTKHWGGGRQLNSTVATLLARLLTGRIKDPMAGFFAIHRSTFEDARGLDPIGYKIGLELICRCRCRHVVEVPITFEDRVGGRSKLNLEQQMRYLIHLDRLYRDCAARRGMLVRPIIWAMLGALHAYRCLTCLGRRRDHALGIEPRGLKRELSATDCQRDEIRLRAPEPTPCLDPYPKLQTPTRPNRPAAPSGFHPTNPAHSWIDAPREPRI